MKYKYLIHEPRDFISIIYINRPKKLNSLNIKVLDEINHLLKILKKDNSVRIIIITGKGDKAFVAGADISEFSNFKSSEGYKLSMKGQSEVFNFIETLNKPVIAAINGYALGGGLELALCCHIRIASKVSKMGLPETSLGIIPGYGGTQRLAQIVGRGIANEMILTGSMIDSSRALSIGLISKVVNSKELIDSAIDISKKILINSPFAISKAIKAINFGFNHNKNGLKKEIELFSECFDSEDFNEGTNAFIEKRKPNFKGE